MELPKIPENPTDWTIEKLDELIKIPDIESETFDFKKEPNELEEHICSMANTRGGVLVLGISQIDSEDGTRIIRFEKKGFPSGSEETITNQITNSAYNIEPLPEVKIEHLKEDEKFYTILKIESKNSEKPYFVKNTDQCFIRLHNSKRRASRSVIFNLFSSVAEKRENIERLRSSSNLLKEEINKTMDFLKAINPKQLSNTAPVNLTFIRNSVLTTDSFLRENGFWEKSNFNFAFVFNIVELINSYIIKFNNSTTIPIRTGIKEMLTGTSHIYPSELNQVGLFLNKVVETCDSYLAKFK